MGIIKQRSPFLGNTNNINGYLQGLTDGQKRGMEAMKIFACVEFIKSLKKFVQKRFKRMMTLER